MGLCSDSTTDYTVFGPCLDFSLIPCEEKKAVSVFGGGDQFSSNQDRVGPSSNHGPT